MIILLLIKVYILFWFGFCVYEQISENGVFFLSLFCVSKRDSHHHFFHSFSFIGNQCFIFFSLFYGFNCVNWSIKMSDPAILAWEMFTFYADDRYRCHRFKNFFAIQSAGIWFYLCPQLILINLIISQFLIADEPKR